MLAKYIPLTTLVRKEILRFLRVWSQSLIPPMVTSALFILIFGYSLGSRITDVAGVSYLEFIVPGLVMMGIIVSSYAGSSFSLYLSKFQGSIQELLVSPISYWQIIAGFTIAAVLRGALVGLGILIISLLFTPIQIHSLLVLLYFILAAAVLFALAGIATALWANNFEQVSVFSTFLITPLTYLGGVFYSIHMLPEFWASMAAFNPILYMVDGFRYGFLGVSDVSVQFSAFLVLGIALFFFILCVHLFRIGYKLRT